MSSLVVTETFPEVGGLFLAIVIVPLSKAGETIFLELISLIMIFDNDKFIYNYSAKSIIKNLDVI